MGRPPKRDSERMRDQGRSTPRTEPAEKITPVELDFLLEPVVQPAPSPRWHPIAAAWYAALGKSGQSIFYEPSDWALAMMIAESMSRDLGPKYVRMRKVWVPGERDENTREWLDGHYEEEPVYEQTTINGAALSAYMAGMAKLLVSEVDRRTFRMEVERGPQHAEAHVAPVLSIARTRDELLGVETPEQRDEDVS